MILKTIFGIFLLTSFVQGDEEVSQKKWGDFKIKWTLPGTKFLDQPQTKDDAVSKNWNKVSDGCQEVKNSDEDEVFKGIRYNPPKENPELIAIYDVQGYIAGMQSVVSKKFDTSQYDFENSGWYKKGTVLGEDVYLLTVFFTDPTKICSKGRSAKDFENQGIGNILWFEKTDGSLVQAPLTMDKADDGCFWFRHKCFLNMGTHYLNMGYGNKTDCRKASPMQLIYIDNHLVGFALQHGAPLGFDSSQLWKVEGKLLKNKANLWRSNEEWNFTFKDKLVCIHNKLKNKVLETTIDGKVILEDAEEDKPEQLWKKGSTQPDGHFTFENSKVPKVMTAISGNSLEIKDLSLGDWEVPSVKALKLSIRDPPTCMIDLVAKEGARVMHVFFRDNLIPMPKCAELNKKEYAQPTVCKAPNDERSGKSIEFDDDETENVESLGSSQSSVAITTFVLTVFPHIVSALE